MVTYFILSFVRLTTLQVEFQSAVVPCTNYHLNTRFRYFYWSIKHLFLNKYIEFQVTANFELSPFENGTFYLANFDLWDACIVYCTGIYPTVSVLYFEKLFEPVYAQTDRHMDNSCSCKRLNNLVKWRPLSSTTKPSYDII